MGGEPRDSLSAQVGYLTSAVEALRDDFKDHRAELKVDLLDFRNHVQDHVKEDVVFQKYIVREVEDINKILARQRGFVAGALLVASATGGALAWLINTLMR